MSQATPLRHAGKPTQAADVVRINVSGTKYSVGKFMLRGKKKIDAVELPVHSVTWLLLSCAT